MPGQDAGDEELGDRDVGAHAVDDHDDRGRNQQAERAGAGQRADDHLLGVAARLSSGSVILPMVAQVAALEPDTAAKMAQPTMLVCSSRPGRR